MKSSSTLNVKQLKGDGLRVNMDINDLNLKVSGDGCRVTVARNCGSIRVVGDGCSLKVNCNEGDIAYEGDGGSILLGGGSRTESVSYVGDGGKISVGKRISGSAGRKSKRSVRKNCGDDLKTPFCTVSDSELEVNLENAANERKEAREKNLSATDLRNERNLRRRETIVVTKISTEQIPVSIKTNHFIKNWFKSSPEVTRSFKSQKQPESL